MLYDPKWKRQTRADPFTLESLIKWLEKQEPSTKYDWRDCKGGCLIGKYYTAMGIAQSAPYEKVFGKKWIDDYGAVCSSLVGPATFGAALKRARRILAKRG